MTISGFVGEPTPPGAIDARPNFLRPRMLANSDATIDIVALARSLVEVGH